MPKLPIEVVVALIALIGVVVSAALSWLISNRQVEAAAQRFRLEIQKTYAANLHDQRLDSYAKLYMVLSGYAADIQKQQADYEGLQLFIDTIDDWYHQNGLLLTATSNGAIYTFLRTIRNIASTSDNAYTALGPYSYSRQ